MKSSMLRTVKLMPLPFCSLGAMMNWADGLKRDRKRFQSRSLPAGPDITSKAAVIIAVIDSTSAGLAAGEGSFLVTVCADETGAHRK